MASFSVVLSRNLGRPSQSVVTWRTGPEDVTPTWRVAAVRQPGDISYLRYSTDPFFATFTEIIIVWSPAHVLAGYYEHTVLTALAAATYSVQEYATRSHPAGHAVASAPSEINALNLTPITTAPDGAPIVATQTFELGRSTRTGVEFRKIVSTGGEITGEGVGNSIAGAFNNHFTLNGVGEMITTQAYQDNPQTSYALTLTLSNLAGSTTAACAITTVPREADVRTNAQFAAALTHLKSISSNGTLDCSLALARDAVIGDYASSVLLQGPTALWAGTLVDPNENIPDGTPLDTEAISAFSGGKLTIRCRDPLGARISGQVSINGGSGLHLVDLIIDRTGPVPFLKGDGTWNATAALSQRIINITRNATKPTYPQVLFTRCVIGCASVTTDARRWIKGITAQTASRVILEDCVISGCYSNVGFGGVNFASMKRCDVTKMITDAVTTFGVNSATVDPVVRHLIKTHPFNRDTTLEGGHGDGYQHHTPDDQRSIKARFSHCISDGEHQAFFGSGNAPPWEEGGNYPKNTGSLHNSTCVHGGRFWSRIGTFNGTVGAANLVLAGTAAYEPGVGASWTALWEDLGANGNASGITLNVEFFKCLATSKTVWGFVNTRGNGRLDKCTSLFWPFGGDGTNTARNCNIHTGKSVVDCLNSLSCGLTGDASLATDTNNFFGIDAAAQFGPTSYPANFYGPFTWDAGLGAYTWVNTAVTGQQLWDQLSAIFTPIPGSNAANRGFTI